jgi:2-polyprenyl-3-methyl-5-hydroxy-6-metoxy-1,4-benzoquinol methylase
VTANRRLGDTVAIPGGYQHRARTAGFVVQRYWHAEKERLVDTWARPAPGERALDVGCGSGVVAAHLAGYGAEVLGVDGNPAAIAYAQETFRREGLAFTAALVDELELRPASWDRVYCLELIEHLYPGQAASLLEHLREITRPGGTLLLTTPNYRGVWPAVEWALDRLRLVPRLAGDQHVSRWHRRSLAELLQAAGWRVERLATFSTVAPFASVFGWRLARGLSRLEDRLDLPFGNLLMALCRAPA